MITREILDAQRGLYVKGRDEAIASISAFNGAIECLDHLLNLLDQFEQAQATKNTEAAATIAAAQTTEVNENG